MTPARHCVDFARSVYCLLPYLFDLQLVSNNSGRLPNLDRLARSCRRIESAPLTIEQVLQQALQLDQQRDLPSAALRYLGLGGDPGHACWARLQPVHLRPDRDRLLVFPLDGETGNPPAGLLDLLNSHFADDGCCFLRVDDDWFVRFDRPLSALTSSLIEAQHGGVEEAMPRGADAAFLKRLLTEMQMLLAQLAPPGQQLLFNGFWLSGVGALDALDALPVSVQLLGDSPLLQGLRQLVDQQPMTLEAVELMRPVVVFIESDRETAMAEAETIMSFFIARLRSSGRRSLIIADQSGRSLEYQPPLVYPFWKRVSWLSLLESEIGAELLNEQDML